MPHPWDSLGFSRPTQLPPPPVEMGLMVLWRTFHHDLSTALKKGDKEKALEVIKSEAHPPKSGALGLSRMVLP